MYYYKHQLHFLKDLKQVSKLVFDNSIQHVLKNVYVFPVNYSLIIVIPFIQ